MLTKEQFAALMYPKYEAWAKQQSASTDGFEYEETFGTMLHDLGYDLLQQTAQRNTVGEENPVCAREKKSPNGTRDDKCKSWSLLI